MIFGVRNLFSNKISSNGHFSSFFLFFVQQKKNSRTFFQLVLYELGLPVGPCILNIMYVQLLTCIMLLSLIIVVGYFPFRLYSKFRYPAGHWLQASARAQTSSGQLEAQTSELLPKESVHPPYCLYGSPGSQTTEAVLLYFTEYVVYATYALYKKVTLDGEQKWAFWKFYILLKFFIIYICSF